VIAGLLREKIEDYVSILFLPLYFASSGLKTNLSAIKSNTGSTYHLRLEALSRAATEFNI
jgi:Kef-type K+ transport system membrane component KefB